MHKEEGGRRKDEKRWPEPDASFILDPSPLPALPPERPPEATRNRLQQARFRLYHSHKRLDESWRCLDDVQARGAGDPREEIRAREILRCADCGATQQTHPEIDPGWVWITLGGVRRVFCPPCVHIEGPTQCETCGNWCHEHYGEQCPWCVR